MKPPCKRSRTTNGRLADFLPIHTGAHRLHSSSVFWAKTRWETVVWEEHMSKIMSFAERAHISVNQTQYMLQCHTLSDVWIGACSELRQVSSASAWNLRGKEPKRENYAGTETTCNRDVQTWGSLMHPPEASSLLTSKYPRVITTCL